MVISIKPKSFIIIYILLVCFFLCFGCHYFDYSYVNPLIFISFLLTHFFIFLSMRFCAKENYLHDIFIVDISKGSNILKIKGKLLWKKSSLIYCLRIHMQALPKNIVCIFTTTLYYLCSLFFLFHLLLVSLY